MNKKSYNFSIPLHPRGNRMLTICCKLPINSRLFLPLYSHVHIYFWDHSICMTVQLAFCFNLILNPEHSFIARRATSLRVCAAWCFIVRTNLFITSTSPLWWAFWSLPVLRFYNSATNKWNTSLSQKAWNTLKNKRWNYSGHLFCTFMLFCISQTFLHNTCHIIWKRKTKL